MVPESGANGWRNFSRAGRCACDGNPNLAQYHVTHADEVLFRVAELIAPSKAIQVASFLDTKSVEKETRPRRVFLNFTQPGRRTRSIHHQALLSKIHRCLHLGEASGTRGRCCAYPDMPRVPQPRHGRLMEDGFQSIGSELNKGLVKFKIVVSPSEAGWQRVADYVRRLEVCEDLTSMRYSPQSVQSHLHLEPATRRACTPHFTASTTPTLRLRSCRSLREHYRPLASCSRTLRAICVDTQAHPASQLDSLTLCHAISKIRSSSLRTPTSHFCTLSSISPGTPSCASSSSSILRFLTSP